MLAVSYITPTTVTSPHIWQVGDWYCGTNKVGWIGRVVSATNVPGEWLVMEYDELTGRPISAKYPLLSLMGMRVPWTGALPAWARPPPPTAFSYAPINIQPPPTMTVQFIGKSAPHDSAKLLAFFAGDTGKKPANMFGTCIVCKREMSATLDAYYGADKMVAPAGCGYTCPPSQLCSTCRPRGS